MEKGSFHASRTRLSLDSQRETEERIKSIPLPNQMPKGIDFSELPPDTLKSSSVETLIGQNEDLMARLAVGLRKNTELEERIATADRDLKALSNRFETLKEQFLVLQEKDRIGSSRSGELQEQNLTFRQKSFKLEKMYADLFVQAQALQRRLVRLERYRAQVRKAARGIRTKLAETKYLREQVADSAAERQRLVSGFEVRLKEAQEMVGVLRDKAAERDKMFGEKVRIENELVFERRHNTNVRDDLQSRLRDLEAETAAMRMQLKETVIARESQRLELERLNSETQALREARVRLGDQVESLQALWNHKQVELERLDEKNKNLQKLNQNISVTLNQQRKEAHLAKAELEQTRTLHSDKVKALNEEIRLLRERLIEQVGEA